MQEYSDYTIHAACALVPDLTEAEYQALKASIAETGQHKAIWREANTGAIIDGRHRLRACLELGIEPEFYDSKFADPYHYVASTLVSQTISRKLSKSQLALFAAGLAESGKWQRGERNGAKLAKEFGLSAGIVSEAGKVLAECDEATIDAVRSGELSVRAAYKQVQAELTEPAEWLAKPPVLLTPTREAEPAPEPKASTVKPTSVAEALDTLPEALAQIIRMRFGYEGKTQTLEAVGAALGKTREHIRQQEAKAMRMLRHPSRSGGLKPLAEALPAACVGRMSADERLLRSIFGIASEAPVTAPESPDTPPEAAEATDMPEVAQSASQGLYGGNFAIPDMDDINKVVNIGQAMPLGATAKQYALAIWPALNLPADLADYAASIAAAAYQAGVAAVWQLLGAPKDAAIPTAAFDWHEAVRVAATTPPAAAEATLTAESPSSAPQGLYGGEEALTSYDMPPPWAVAGGCGDMAEAITARIDELANGAVKESVKLQELADELDEAVAMAALAEAPSLAGAFKALKQAAKCQT